MTDTNIEWWRAAKEQKHSLLFAWCNYCAQENQTQRMDTQIFVSACSNFNPTGNDEYDYAIRSAFKTKMRDNILQAGVDTAVSMIALARTAPQYITTAADWPTSRKAEKRSRVLQGQFYDLGVFTMVPEAFRNACEGGTGYVIGLVGPDGMPRLRLGLHNEVYWDPEDARYGTPRRLAYKEFVDRDELLREYEGDAEMQAKIMAAEGPSQQDHMDFFIRRNNKANRVAVVHGWSLPTVDRGDDGVYVKAISSGTLVEKSHTRRRHRCVRVLFAKRAQGYAGQSLVERMMPAQVQLNDTDDYIARTQRLGSVAKWFVEKNSGVTEDQVTNAAAQVHVINQGSKPPVLVSFSATPPDLVQQRESIKEDAYNAQGFGDNTVTGDVNKGLASGEAVQRADDVKVRRFLNPARLLEGDEVSQLGYLGVCRLLEDLNDECTELDENYTVKARNRSGRRTWLKTSKWKDLQLDTDNDASMTMFPISAQATTAAAKYEQVQKWIERGWVSKPMAMDLQGMPDTEAFEELENSDLDLVHEQLDNLIDLEDANPDMLLPVAYQDLELAAVLVSQGRRVAWRLNAPDEVLARFERYLGYLQELQKKANPPAPVLTPTALGPSAAAAAQLAAPAAGPAAPLSLVR